MQLILAVIGVMLVFIVCFLIVQWAIRLAARNAPPEIEAARVRRTLENGAQTLGGSDYLHTYLPLEEKDPPTRGE